MKTLRLFAMGQTAIHPITARYLSDLGEFRGKQELYTRQSPPAAEVLARARDDRECRVIESHRGRFHRSRPLRDILGVPKPLFRDRNEEEVRGYRDALAWIHAEAATLSLDEKTIKRLHAMARGQIWDAGQYKEKDGDIIERYPDGSERVRFRTVPAADTPARMADLVLDWRRCQDEGWVPPPIALAAFNLDFLCIHPFRDGNGRVSRLLWLMQSYQLGYEVGRYVSLERLVESLLRDAGEEFAGMA